MAWRPYTGKDCASSQEFLATQENLVLSWGMPAKSPPVGRDALLSAIASKGSLSAFARSIGVQYQLVQGWLSTVRKYATPPAYVLAVERATGVARHQLRPDIWPPEEAQPPRAHGGDVKPHPLNPRGGPELVPQAAEQPTQCGPASAGEGD